MKRWQTGLRQGLKQWLLICAASIVVVSLASARRAIAETQTAETGGVRADYSDRRDRFCATDRRLQISRNGQTVFNQLLSVNELCRLIEPFTVQDLDGDREPEVILNFFSGGAHCCTFSLLFTYSPTQQRYTYIQHPWGNPGAKLEDLDGDRLAEFKSADDRFAYAFTSYAGSGLPIQIWQYRQGRMIDVTRSYPDAIYSSAYRHWQFYTQARDRGSEVKGLLAAYLAEKYLLGEAEDGWNRVRQAYQGSDRQSFFIELNQFLNQKGYTAQSLPPKPVSVALTTIQTNSRILLQQQGRLDRNDTVLQSDGSLYDAYSFEGRSGQQVTITLESSEFDTYLILLDPNGTDIEQNDDISQSNTNSSIVITLPIDGTYTVLANSYDRNNLGRYALTVSTAQGVANRGEQPLSEQTIASLPDGNYRFCDRPAVSAVMRDRELSRYDLWCFLFSKRGDQIVGNFWSTVTFGEYGACVSGIVESNMVRGEVIDTPYDQRASEISPELLRSRTFYDSEGYLQVSNAAIVGDKIIFRQALLNLEKFFRYNLGSSPPPTSCAESRL